jgi:hypothetical protein
MTDLTLFDQMDIKIPIERFHNSIHLEGDELRKRERKTKAQNWLILEYFRVHEYENFTPFEIQKRMGFDNIPITSIRRAISDLTEMGYLVKTDVKRPGIYGESNYCWKLK